MATIRVEGDALQVRFTPVEKALGLVRDHDFPLSTVRSARVADDALGAVRGLRVGLGVPGFRKIGTWLGHGRTLVSVRRDQPAVVIDLAGRVAHVVIGSDEATDVVTDVVARLRGRG